MSREIRLTWRIPLTLTITNIPYNYLTCYAGVSTAAPTPAATNRLAISADEMAELLGISRAHVWRLHSQGRIPRPVRLAGPSGGIGNNRALACRRRSAARAVGSDAQRK